MLFADLVAPTYVLPVLHPRYKLAYFDEHNWLPEWKATARELLKHVYSLYEDAFMAEMGRHADVQQPVAQVRSIFVILILTHVFSVDHSRPLLARLLTCLTTTMMFLRNYSTPPTSCRGTCPSHPASARTSWRGGLPRKPNILSFLVWPWISMLFLVHILFSFSASLD
jgi:hypothetical protein